MHGSRDAMHCVSAVSPANAPTIPTRITIPATNTGESQNKFGAQSKNLASIVRGFKSSVTTNARKMADNDFNWQTLFHDHIIRDTVDFERIQNYISNNPLKWDADKFKTDAV
jgi:hypothetical protein